jgi:hypothetical protein
VQAVTVTYLTHSSCRFKIKTISDGINISKVANPIAIVIGPCGAIKIPTTFNKYTNAINDIVNRVIIAANLFASCSFLDKILLLFIPLPPHFLVFFAYFRDIIAKNYEIATSILGSRFMPGMTGVS